MIEIITFIVAFIILIKEIVISFERHRPIQDVLGKIFFIGMFVLTLNIIIVALFSKATRWNEVERVTYTGNIYSLNTSSSINGCFFLGSGTFLSSESYTFYQKNDRGGFVKFHESINDCVVFEDETNQPYILWQTIKYQSPQWLLEWPKLYKSENTKIDIHIPPNSIIEKYEPN